MNHARPHRPARPNRSGATLVVFAISLPVLLGAVGLVIDAGLLAAARRQARTAADAAALAASHDLMRDRSLTVATATATNFVRQYNGLPLATVEVKNPPESGPYLGESRFVEVQVRTSVTTWLIQILGGDAVRTVSARAVAGYEPVAAGPSVIALDPSARPGLSISGGGSLIVAGGVAINSEGGGVDENGQPIGNGNSGTAASVSNNSTFQAESVTTVGGVNTPANFKPYDPSETDTPLDAGSVSYPDPFLELPPPTIANGADPTERPAVHVTGNQSVTLQPGVYPSITIGSGSVVFEPGIYIIKGGDLKITEQNVVADGVMFYLTGDDYNVSTGLPDVNDRDTPPPTSGTTNFGSVTINAGLNFSAYNDPGSAFHGMMFYQRRWNTEEFSIQGNSSAGNLAGTMYAKWANMKIAGQGTYGSQLVVASLETTGTGAVTIRDTDDLVVRADQTFLVE